MSLSGFRSDGSDGERASCTEDCNGNDGKGSSYSEGCDQMDSEGESCGGGDHENHENVTPEPASIMLLGTGIVVLGGVVRRKFVSQSRSSLAFLNQSIKPLATDLVASENLCSKADSG